MNAWIEVDFDALRENLRSVRESMLPATPQVIGIVKANAYGHGAVAVAGELEKLGVDRLGVVWASEARVLREAGIRAPTLVLGHSFPEDAPSAVRDGLTLTVHSMEVAEALSREAMRLARGAKAHIKVDTGLHRFGLNAEDAIALAEAMREMPGVEVEALWTHMANADEEDDSFSEQQLERFTAVAERLAWIPVRHAGNSSTALRRPELRLSAVRMGLSLYGIAPSGFGPDPGLRPVLSLKARLARVMELGPGEGVSYGLTWKAAAKARVGLVPVGYGDGWKRQLAGMGEVLVGGRRCGMVGRVMMDHFVVDITSVDAQEGSEVVLLGAQGSEQVRADEVGARAGTIAWDVLASLQARLPRLYLREGKVVARS